MHELQFLFFYSPTSFLIFLLCTPFLFQQKHEEEEAILTGPPCSEVCLSYREITLGAIIICSCPHPPAMNLPQSLLPPLVVWRREVN